MSQFTFGQPVENIAASEDNPTKRGFFVRYSGPRVEYVSPIGHHITSADNLRPIPPAMAQSNGDAGDSWTAYRIMSAQLEAARKALEETRDYIVNDSMYFHPPENLLSRINAILTPSPDGPQS